MSHYTLHASQSIGDIINGPEAGPTVWRDWVTELAFQNDYLLHGLLSLSALHLALSGVSPRRHTVVAMHQHGLGVALFRPQLSRGITADNYDAVFAFSCVVAVYAFGIPRCCSESTFFGDDDSSGAGDDPITKLLQVLILLRRSSVVAKSAHEVLLQSRWSMLMLPWASLDSVAAKNNGLLPEEIKDMISNLLQRVQITTSSTKSITPQQNVYISTIEILKLSLVFALSRPRAQLTLTLFPIITPAEFWTTLVRRREPFALAILANYSVILHWFKDNIWLHGWGKESIEAVRQALPPEWHDCIAWAIRQTECASPWS